MGGCGFQEKCNLYPSLDCEAENWPTQDRSVTETNSIEFGVGEGTSALEDEDDLQPA